MNKQKPEILIFDNIIEPIKNSIIELHLIAADLNQIEKNFYLKGLFAYVFSLFESSISECTKRYLCSCPNKIPDGKLKLDKKQQILIDNIFSQDVVELLVNDYFSYITYGKAENFFTFFSSILSINDIGHLYTKSLIEKKERRNLLLHNNLVVDNKYIRNTKCNPRMRGKKLPITKEYLKETIDSITEIFKEINIQLEKKYSSYTKNKAIREIWYYLFNSPLMIFEQHWIIKDDKIIGYNSNHLKKVVNNLSSSEKTILSYWLQNFNSSICDQFFKFSDMNMQVSNNEMMIYLVEIFNRYPLLLQD